MKIELNIKLQICAMFLKMSLTPRLIFYQNHLVEMESDDLPDSLVGKKDELFSNIKDIYDFHTRFDAFTLSLNPVDY